MLAMIRGSIAVLLALAIPYAAHAQSMSGPPGSPGASQEPIPRELALALLNLGQGSGGMDIRVGKAPDNVPPELVPLGAELLGSMTQFDNSVIVVAMALPPDSAISTLEGRLLDIGWTKPPVPNRMPRGGFVSADNGVGYERPDIVCRGDEFVAFSGSYRRMGGSVIKLSYNRGGRYSACRTQTDQFRSPYEEAPIPTLRAPEGAMTTGGGGMSMSGANQVSMSTQLSTRLEPAAVIAHYDKQMRAAGWESTSEGAAQTVAAHTYRKKDEKNRTWMATLVSISVPDGLEQDVMLRLTRR